MALETSAYSAKMCQTSTKEASYTYSLTIPGALRGNLQEFNRCFMETFGGNATRKDRPR